MSLPSGASLGPYVITRALGAGGMGEVYSARDPRLDREVAIKVLRGGHACSGEYRRRFEQEARAVARLNHPNVIAIYDVGHAAIDDAPSGAPFLVMEILDGRTLGELIRDGPLG